MMNTQLSFLPEIDRKATQKNVEQVLETTRIYRQIGFVRREISNTPSYEPRLHGNTNKTSNQTADCSIWNVDHEQEVKTLAERVESAVNRLDKKEREIIQKRYLEDVDALDYLLHHEVGVSQRTYERIKSRAFYKLALMLKIEVVYDDAA